MSMTTTPNRLMRLLIPVPLLVFSCGPSVAEEKRFDLRLRFKEKQRLSYLIVKERARMGIGRKVWPFDKGWPSEFRPGVPEAQEAYIYSFLFDSRATVEGKEAFQVQASALFLDRDYAPPLMHVPEPLIVLNTGHVCLKREGQVSQMGKGEDLPFIPASLSRGTGFPTLPSGPVAVGEKWEETYKVAKCQAPFSGPVPTYDVKVSYRLWRVADEFSPTHRGLQPIAVIPYSGEGSFSAEAHPPHQPERITTYLRITGTMYFSMKTHQIVKVVQRVTREGRSESELNVLEWSLQKILIANPAIEVSLDRPSVGRPKGRGADSGGREVPAAPGGAPRGPDEPARSR